MATLSTGRIRALLLGSIFTLCGLFALLPRTAHAADISMFDPGYIIADDVFYSSNSMTSDQIQSFLNSKVSSCDTQGSIGPYYDKYGNRWNTRADYGNANSAPPPYTCLKDFRQSISGKSSDAYCNGVGAGSDLSAAQIIYNVAQSCGISPKVLIVLLQKEQGLVTDDWPWPIQYRSATGMGCPDTSSCDSQYYGFFNQVYGAARQFNMYKANPDDYGYLGGRNNYIKWHPDFWNGSAWEDRCGGSTVFIRNQATAGLYNYTPYQPNSAALGAGYGTGDGCSSYGNRNFWLYFNDWFGSSTILPELIDRYDYLKSNGSPMGTPTDGGYCVDGAHTTCWQGFQNGYIVYNKNTGAWESYGAIRSRWGQLGYQNGQMGLPTGPVICGIKDSGCYQQYQNGYIVGTSATGYWESAGSIRLKWSQLGFENGKMGYPTGPIQPVTAGGYYQQYQNGFIIGNNTTGYWESMYGPIRDRWGALGYHGGRLGFPTAAPDCTLPDSGCKQTFQGGVIFWTEATGAWQTWGAIGARYGQLGATSGSLGYPTGPEVCGTIRDNGCFQQYQNGYIVGNSSSGWWESMYGPVRDRWSALGYQDGRLGYPTGAPNCTLPNSGCSQSFQGGSIFWTSTTGAWQVWGAIAGRYTQLNAASGTLGYPIDAESCGTIRDNGCFQRYQNGYIVGTPATGWWESTGSIRNRWGQLGYENGQMGYPTGPIYQTASGGYYQQYQNGFIVGSNTTGYWESFGAIRSKWASLGYESGEAGYPTSAVSCASGTCSQTYEHGTIYANQSTSWYTP